MQLSDDCVERALQGQMVNDAGKLVVIEELEAAQLLAPRFFICSKNNLPVNIIAVEPSEILFIHQDDFYRVDAAEQAASSKLPDADIRQEPFPE